MDLRSDHQRARAATGPVGDFESRAARVVARMTGDRVILQDDNNQPATPDLRIDYAERAPGYVEVSIDIDERYAEMSALIAKRGYQIPAPQLGRIWWVTLPSASNLGRLSKRLPGLLAQLQALGETFEVAAEHEHLLRSSSWRVADLMELGIVGVVSRPVRGAEAGVIHLLPQGIGGRPDLTWEPFLDWVEQVLSSPGLHDVRSKLAGTAVEERHVFLGASFTSPWEVFFALEDEQRDLPPAPPRLPSEINHLWVMNAQVPGRCLAWFPARGWLDTRRHWATA